MHEANEDLTLFLSSYDAGIRNIALKLRELVLELAPGAIEQIDLPARLIAFDLARTYKDTICVIMPHKTYVNLGFPKGAKMPDPGGLLTGTGKRARHVKISNLEEIGKPEIRSLIQEAIRLVICSKGSP